MHTITPDELAEGFSVLLLIIVNNSEHAMEVLQCWTQTTCLTTPVIKCKI